MSKRRNEYQKGVERLCGYLEMFYQDGYPPSKREIEDELHTIYALKHLKINLFHEVDVRTKERNAFFFLINEHYNRYDDVLPNTIDLILLPSDEDEPKEIQRHLTQRQVQAFY